MALIVGNLLTDPAAQSFISVAAADAYLMPERHEAWDLAGDDRREAALVQASRWLAGAYDFRPLDFAQMIRLGQVAARLAVEMLSSRKASLFAGTDTAKAIKTAKAGSAEITYQDGLKADAAGMAWPWLKPMLAGLIVSGNLVRVFRA